VLTVIVVVAAVVPVMSTDGPMLHVGKFVAPEGLLPRAHFRPTVPTKPPDGVTEIVDVLPIVAPAVTETAVPDRLKLPVELLALTVRTIVVLAVEEPLDVEPDPVTVTMYDPVVVVPVVLIVTVDEPSVELLTITNVGLMLHVGALVAPAGLVVIAHVRLTLPENPSDGVTTTVPVLFCATPATTLIELGPLRLNAPLPELLPDTFTVPLPLLTA
jgi:hypothetical protein